MTTSIDGPRLLHAEEFREAMALVNRCFGFDPGELEARMPHCFDEDHPERHAIVRIDGDVASHVVCVPAELRAGEARVACHGIAGVATDPDHRGNGYMTRLLEFWLDRLAECDVPLAELEGDRIGYGRFGWENAGRELRYRLAGRSLDVEGGGVRTVRPYEGPDDITTIREIHEAERYRVSRDRRRYEQLLGQTGLETLLAPGDDPAYLCFRGEDPADVLEFGGARDGLAALLVRLLDRFDETVVYTHPHHPRNELFRAVARDWDRGPHRKLNLLDLPGTLEAYEPLLEERWSRFSDAFGPTTGSVTLAIDDDVERSLGSEGDAATIAYGPGGLDVVRDDREPDVTLDRREMVDLLFGSGDLRRPAVRSNPLLEAVLPLEFYFWRTETI